MRRPRLTGALQQVPNLVLHFDAPDRLRLVVADEEVLCGREGLLILDIFRRSIPAVIARTQLKGLASAHRIPWGDVEATLERFVDYGVLCDASGKRTISATDGLESAPYHIAMLNDRSRTSAYLDAIRRTVREGDVVLDIGTGTGVLAMGAAMAGAARVYAIERGPIALLAQKMFEGFPQIKLIRGSSHNVELPEQADVLVSELIGDEPLAEGHIASTRDAFKRHLKPEARCVPQRLRIFAIPLAIPDERLAAWTLNQETVRRWKEWYGLDYTPLLPLIGSSNFIVHVFPQSVRDLEPLAEPVLIMDLDLSEPEDIRMKKMETRVAQRSGRANGLLTYFEIELCPEVLLTTHPRDVPADNHWRSPLWLHRDSFEVKAGEPFHVHVAYRTEWGRMRMGLHPGGAPDER